MMRVRNNKGSDHKHTESISSLFNSANGVMEVTRDLVIFIYNNYSLVKNYDHIKGKYLAYILIRLFCSLTVNGNCFISKLHAFIRHKI